MSALKDLLARAKERSKALELQKQSQIRPTSKPVIEINPARRGENLRILRAFLDAHQENFVSMLGIGSQSLYSKIERGDSLLDEKQARKIEASLGLPLGWLERNNGDSIFFSNDECQLITEIRKSAPEATVALIEAVKSIRSSRGNA